MSGDYRAKLVRGQLLRQSGLHRQACTFLREAIQADPHRAQAFLELALAQSALPDEKDQTLETIDRAVALEPNSDHFLGFKAYLLSKFGRHREALELGDDALATNPTCRIALLAQTNAHTKLNQWNRAELMARRMLELDAHDSVALNLLAQALRRQDRDEESRQVVAQVLAVAPNDASAQANAGYVAFKSKDHDEAQEHFLNALRADPNYDHAHYGLAIVHNNRGLQRRKQGDLEGALADFEKAIELKPGYAEAYNNHGLVRITQGDLAGALADFDKAIELKPNMASAYYNRGLVLNKQNKFDGARAAFDRAIEIKPEYAEAYSDRGLSKRAMGDWAGALADFDSAIKSNPRYAEGYHNRGFVRNAQGDAIGAGADFDKAIELKPTLAASYNCRGLLRNARGDRAGARADYNKALELDPGYAEAYNNRGLVRRTQRDLVGAMADFNKAIELKPRLAQSYNNRGLVKKAQGDRKGALADFEKAIELKPDFAAAHKNLKEARGFRGGILGV